MTSTTTGAVAAATAENSDRNQEFHNQDGMALGNGAETSDQNNKKSSSLEQPPPPPLETAAPFATLTFLAAAPPPLVPSSVVMPRPTSLALESSSGSQAASSSLSGGGCGADSHHHPSGHHGEDSLGCDVGPGASLSTPRHSDFTIPTSNRRSTSPPMRVVDVEQSETAQQQPPPSQLYQQYHHINNDDHHRHDDRCDNHATNNTNTSARSSNHRLLPPTGTTIWGNHNHSSRQRPPHQQQQQPRKKEHSHRLGNNNPAAANNDDQSSSSSFRRNIFGMAVEQRYQTMTDFSRLHPPTGEPVDSFPAAAVSQQPPPQQPLVEGGGSGSIVVNHHYWESPSPSRNNNNENVNAAETCSSGQRRRRRNKNQTSRSAQTDNDQLPSCFAMTTEDNENDNLDNPNDQSLLLEFGEDDTDSPSSRPTLSHNSPVDGISELTMDYLPSSRHVNHNHNSNNKSKRSNFWTRWMRRTGSVRRHGSSYSSGGSGSGNHHHHQKYNPKVPMAEPGSSPERHDHHLHPHQRPHETIHAQALVLGLAFCAIWSPSNVMAPNLTEMAEFFHFDHAQRDLYLGSYCALATGVFSFPIGAGIGILADMVNRRYLFCLTMVGSALAALATGQAHNYPQFIAARLVNGGFMAGSVPVAFSFLGDLFAVEERNAASSGLTAMMGLGIILGQVYAGTVGPTLGWQHAFTVSAAVTLVLAGVCLLLVQEPERGGKERVLQDMIRAGTRYERKLSWQGFWHACLKNASNSILLWQGFFSSLPWGVIFVFLNDYLSQERGFSVPAATFLVFLFGMGCAAGGVLGGYLGQVVQGWNRRYLPLFMAATTELGIVPFVGMLNVKTARAHGPLGVLFAFSSGLIASLPAVNVRPCLINVNPPETRGAALTAANLLIQLGRGMGPSCVTTLVGLANISRQDALNWTLTVFWTISALQLILLSETLPKDQDAMEAELAKYAASVIEQAQIAGKWNNGPSDEDDHIGGGGAVAVPDSVVAHPVLVNERSQVVIMDDTETALLPSQKQHEQPTRYGSSYQSTSFLRPTTSSSQYGFPALGSATAAPEDMSVEVSIADRMTYFDGSAVNQTFDYVRQGFKEFKQELVDVMPCHACADVVESSSEDSINDDDHVRVLEEDDIENNDKVGRNSNRGGDGPHAESSNAAGEAQNTSSLLYSGAPPPIQSMSSSFETDESESLPVPRRATEQTPLLVPRK
ncbi:hypothetical protein ACA910_014506 [Epithemia clementina (nom. ined.)]